MSRPPDRVYVAVKAAVWREDRLLCVREGEAPGSPYDLPGGRLDAGESPHDGLRREIREELGVEIAAHDALPIQLWATRTRRGVGVIGLLFRVTLAPGEFRPAPGDLVTGAEYLTLEEFERAPGGVHKPHALEYFRAARAQRL